MAIDRVSNNDNNARAQAAADQARADADRRRMEADNQRAQQQQASRGQGVNLTA